MTQRHALLLTDGENRERPGRLDEAINRATGYFQCDCRGAGTDWQVAEIRRIAQALLGTVDIIPRPDEMRAQFQEIMRASMARGVADAKLRVWTPQGAQVLFVRQVAPTLEDLTDRGVAVNPLTRDFPTGAWADESRDYHVGVRVAAKALGQEQLAARVQLALGENVVTQGLVKATWSNNSELTTRIDKQVAHYTGQTELAAMIQEGLAAKAAGDEATATTKLGRAVQLAAETGNDEATSKLKKVVDVENEADGTVRLKRAVDKADEMALDTASTKTTRVRKDRGRELTLPTCPSGHDSTADDYCDVCGLPITDAGPAPTPAGDAPARAAGDGRADAGRARRRDLPELLGTQPGERPLLRGVRLRLHHRAGAARSRRRSTWTRRRHARHVGTVRARRPRTRPADSDPPTAEAQPSIAPPLADCAGSPRSGSTRTGTPTRTRPIRCPRQGCRSSYR